MSHKKTDAPTRWPGCTAGPDAVFPDGQGGLTRWPKGRKVPTLQAEFERKSGPRFFVLTFETEEAAQASALAAIDAGAVAVFVSAV